MFVFFVDMILRLYGFVRYFEWLMGVFVKEAFFYRLSPFVVYFTGRQRIYFCTRVIKEVR
jgi:hypothetical protein